MLEKFLVLLERFVIAHELIAANSGKPGVVIHNDAGSEVETTAPKVKPAPELQVEGAEVVDAKPTPKQKKPSKPVTEDEDLADEPAPVKKEPQAT